MILEDYERIAREALDRANKAKTQTGMLWNLQIYHKAQERIAALRAVFAARDSFRGVVVPRFLPAEDLT